MIKSKNLPEEYWESPFRKIKVKVWCEKCRGGGIDTDKSNWVNSSIFDCKECRGLGYTVQKFYKIIGEK